MYLWNSHVISIARIYCCSWNVNGQMPSVSLDDLFKAVEESKPDTRDYKPDIYAIG